MGLNWLQGIIARDFLYCAHQQQPLRHRRHRVADAAATSIGYQRVILLFPSFGLINNHPYTQAAGPGIKH